MKSLIFTRVELVFLHFERSQLQWFSIWIKDLQNIRDSRVQVQFNRKKTPAQYVICAFVLIALFRIWVETLEKDHCSVMLKGAN